MGKGSDCMSEMSCLISSFASKARSSDVGVIFFFEEGDFMMVRTDHGVYKNCSTMEYGVQEPWFSVAKAINTTLYFLSERVVV